jgi:hypothetical protein
MKYKVIYDKIIEKTRSEKRVKFQGTYYENHHIIPTKCGGQDIPENKVLLTGKEHFTCHHLLIKFLSGWKLDAMIYAFDRMCNENHRGYKVTARNYETAKTLFSEVHSKNMCGEGNPCFGRKLTEDEKEVFSFKDCKHSEETKKKQSESHKGLHDGEKNGNFGRRYTLPPRTKEHSKKIVEARKKNGKCQNTRFKGIIHTPWGNFESFNQACKECPKFITDCPLRKYCLNPDINITKGNLHKGKYFTSDDIGKTFKELGFGFYIKRRVIKGHMKCQN